MSRINCNEVYGWGLRNGLGFESEVEALTTIDKECHNNGSLWKINRKIYELTFDLFLEIPRFEEYHEDTRAE